MAQATLTARIDSKDKASFDEFCNSVGLTSSATINLFVKAVVRERRIPFEICQDPFYSPSNQAYLMRSVRQIESGGGTAPELLEVTDE